MTEQNASESQELDPPFIDRDETHCNDELDRLMGDQGSFSQSVKGYKMRPMQLEMAKSVAKAITGGETFLAEAGTGTGKTYAYLIPALLWGGKVIISTGTKNLQDQLYFKDIQTVRKVLQVPVTIALLKGRSNYLCRYRLEKAKIENLLRTKQDIGYLNKIVKFNQKSETGDRADLGGVPENAAIWEYVTSTRENCLGSECPYLNECFVMKARKEALKADVVVVNHHLFFADLALKDSGVNELLPTANTVIFDEAHQLPDVATVFFGQFISTRQLHELCRDTQVEGLSHARDGADWILLVAAIDKATKDLRLQLPEKAGRFAIHQIQNNEVFLKGVETLIQALDDMVDALQSQSVRSELLQKCFERSQKMSELTHCWLSLAKGETKTDDILWVETFGQTFQLHLTPLSIAHIFGKQVKSGKRAWIFTSATLAIKQDFSYFSTRMGLDDAHSAMWPSPFSYTDHALLYVPKIMPVPQSPSYTDAVFKAALPLIESCAGGIFILCTTIRAVDEISAKLMAWVKERHLEIPLFIQGTAGRHDLLEKFRQSGNGILVGSQSFWEGVDVKGKALSLVIVDKLPFAPPNDPVLAARLNLLERNGGNGFRDYQIPEAIISLKQGVGRLIRDEDDLGVLMICDTRLVDKPYGGKIWRSLPPFARTRDERVACAFLKEKIAVL